MFYKKAAPNNFEMFTGKHLKACNCIKKRLQHKYFPVNITNFLRTPTLKNISERLLLHLFLIKTRKATGFKSLRLKYWEINQATPKCQIDFWTKLAKKV